MSITQRRPVVITGIALAGALGTAIAVFPLGRPDPSSASPVRPIVLSVATIPIKFEEGYTVKRRFSGEVQARRQSELGFESAGKLERVFVDEGSQVAAGQLLAQLDTERLSAQRDELIAARDEAEANLALAEATLRRLRAIVDKGGVSRQGLDEARETQHAAKAALVLARRRISTIDIALDKTRLLAPFPATVTVRAADEGQVLAAGQPILTLQERNAPEIRIGIAGRGLDQLQPGHTYPAIWRDKRITVRLRALLPVRASTTRTVDALFDPIDPPGGMLAGDLVTLPMSRQVWQNGSWLPLSALAEGERGLWSLYVAEPLATPREASNATHRIVRHTVDLLYQNADRVYVRGALLPNQPVVSAGLQRIVPGQEVRLAPTDGDRR